MPQFIIDLIDYLDAWYQTASGWETAALYIVLGGVVLTTLALGLVVGRTLREIWGENHTVTASPGSTPGASTTIPWKSIGLYAVLLLVGAVAGGTGVGWALMNKTAELEAKNGQLIEQLSKANQELDKADKQLSSMRANWSVTETERDAAKAEVEALKAKLAASNKPSEPTADQIWPKCKEVYQAGCTSDDCTPTDANNKGKLDFLACPQLNDPKMVIRCMGKLKEDGSAFVEAPHDCYEVPFEGP